MSPRRAALALALLGLLGGGVPAFGGGVEDGQKALDEHRWAAAGTAFAKALEGAPTSRAAALGLARAATEGSLSERYDAAEEALRGLLKAKADDREARLALGDLYLARVAQDDRWRADAEEQFQRVLAGDPDDVEASVGVARMYWSGGDTKRALESLDGFLEKHAGAALALHWRAMLLYDDATQAFQREGSVTPDVKKAFEAALAAFQASTKADPSRYDGWMHLGYAAQYLTGSDPSLRDVAAAAYRKALDLDGENTASMLGLSALYKLEGSKWVEVLDALAKEKPSTPIVLYWHGWSLHQRKKLDEAEKALAAMVKVSRFPALGWFELGKVLEEKGDAAGAAKAMRRSLEADPTHSRSVEALASLLKPLYDRMRDAQGDASKAKALVQEAAPLLALAPRDTVARNNVGFFAREAFNATHDRVLLDASVRYYVEASALLPEWSPALEQSVPYPSRHASAALLNDTGLMFQYYPAVRDLAKAESYYRRAQEWTQSGYWDAYTNLAKILEEQGRWQDAVDYANECAEGLKNEDGSPNETWRGTAHADAQRFAAKLK